MSYNRGIAAVSKRAARRFGAALGLAALIGLQSCVGPDFKIPESPDIGSFTPSQLPAQNSAGGKTQHLDVGRELPAEWWTLFRSSELTGLMRRALRDNPTFDAAQAAMRAAQANVYAEVGQLFPLATGNYQATGGKVATSPSGGGVAAPVVSASGGNPVYYSLHTAQLTVSYVPDIWGGTRRQIENLEALKENQRFMNEATFLTLTSNIALGAIQEASLREQITVTNRLIAISRDILEKVRLQKELGQLTELDVAGQEALVAQTEATLPPLRKALAQQRDALIVLSGHLPGEGLQEKFEFSSLKLPPHLPVSLPSELVAQRPDVRAAEENFHAACALIGVAIANRLPQFSLNGDIGRSGPLFQNLFSANPAFYFYTGVANATQVIFDGFTLQQRQRAAEAGFDQAAAQYRLAVLTAFQNVADSLYAIRHDTVGLQKAILAEAAAEKTLKLTRIQLNEGQIAFQQVLNAQTVYLQASLIVIQAQANRFSDTVALFQALGGGWWNRASSPHPGAPEAWLTSVIGAKPDPVAVEYPGATKNEAR
ncbi:MAG: efflux transporter outer membrane subunit [Rhodomicrobium sp.]|jgi:NodT family efflux transporter outer membrane factor (OMF) lipoprotein